MPTIISDEVFFGILLLILAFYLVLISNLVLQNIYKKTDVFLKIHNQIHKTHNTMSRDNTQ
jgi:hypothetical protein